MTHEDTTTQIRELGRRWAEAEQRADVDTLGATHIAVRDGAAWRLAGIHLSPIAAPPEARPPP
jgi:hypothetical protein